MTKYATPVNRRAQAVTSDVMSSALERAKIYLSEAVRWSNERETQNEYNAEPHYQRMERAQIPGETWFPLENGFTSSDRQAVLRLLKPWSTGRMDNYSQVCATLDESYDLDPTYIFFGRPIRELSPRQQESLHALGSKFAARNLD